MPGREQELMVRVATMYYLEDLSQQEIGQRLSLSRQKVQRLLARSRDLGIVEIRILDDGRSRRPLEQKLEQRLGLIEARVVSSDPSVMRTQMARIAADTMVSRAKDDMVIGVSWGTTLSGMLPFLETTKKPLRNVRVVQLNGGLARTAIPTGAGYLLEALAGALHGTAVHLPTPAIVDTAEICAALLADSQVRDILELGQRSQMAVFSIGVPGSDSVLVRSGYFDSAYMAQLCQEHLGVGDICSRFFRIDGSLADAALDARTIGIELHRLKDIPVRIAVAGGPEKRQGLLGAARGRYFNCLVTDELTAQWLLEQLTVQEVS